VTFLLHHYDLQDRVLSASEREKVEMGLLRLWRESGLIVAPLDRICAACMHLSR
jgi:hypothetical protein